MAPSPTARFDIGGEAHALDRDDPSDAAACLIFLTDQYTKTP
jgi:hypothetical protein